MTAGMRSCVDRGPTRKFSRIVEAMPADRQQRIEKRLQKSLAAMPLDQLRKAQEMTQFQVAVNQGDWQLAWISRRI